MRQKIVHIIPRLDYFGGIENFIINLLFQSIQSKYQIKLLTFYSENNQKIITELSKYSIEIFPLKKALFENINSKYVRFVLKNFFISYYDKYNSLKSRLHEIDPDLVFSHGEDSEIISSFLFNSYRIVNVIHGAEFFPLNPILRLYLENISRKKFYHTVLVSNVLKNKVPVNRKYSIINCGIDLKKFEIRNNISNFFTEKEIRFGFIGRLEKHKGIYNLIDAFIELKRNYSNVILEIVGSGKDEKIVKAKVPKELCNDIIFRGQIEDITLFYKNIQVLIICSESEGGPLVLLEAMASGVLVITNKVGLVPEIIEDRINGRLIFSNTPAEIFKTMKETIEELELNNNMIKKAKDVVQHYSSKRLASEFDLLASKIISQNQL